MTTTEPSATSRSRSPAPGLVALGCALALAAAQGALSPAAAQSVAGRVVEERDGEAIENAEITLLDAADSVHAISTTDSEGSFEVATEEPGAYTVRVEHLGFADLTTSVIELHAHEATVVEIRLRVEAIALEPLIVVARRRTMSPAIREFYERAEENRRRGRGRIYLREDLQRATSIPQLLHTLPRRRDCEPDYYLDGAPLFPDENLDQLGLHERVEGIEFYRGVGEIPPRYRRNGTCGVVLIWTRPGGDGRPFSWWWALGAAGVAAVLLLAR